jgi:hypothetical protein
MQPMRTPADVEAALMRLDFWPPDVSELAGAEIGTLVREIRRVRIRLGNLIGRQSASASARLDVRDPRPIGLSDDQMSALFAAAHPLPPATRPAFLADCARELALPLIGDGPLHRLIMAVQRRHFRRTRSRARA